MSTFTIRVSTSASNPAGTAYGEQPDRLTPSYFDLVVSNSTDPNLANGVYDAYCLNPVAFISVTRNYTAQNYAGDTAASFVPLGLSSITQAQVDQLNWLLAQNFTSDPKFNGKYIDGEVQVAIWKILGFTDAQIFNNTDPRLLNENGRAVFTVADSNEIVDAARAAVASGNRLVPTDTFFSTIIDPEGTVQPLIVQLQSAKLGNFDHVEQHVPQDDDAG